MNYLDPNFIERFDPREFREADPYPWMNPQGMLTPEGYEALLNNMPDVGLFTPFFGVQRKYGQQSHERFVLEYVDGLDLPAPWQAFIDELRGDAYRGFIADLLGRGHFRFRFHWHYTPRGCSVSPHCDARGKLGSHIFYLNREENWDPAWGGETVILDDHGRFPAQSSPAWEDFDEAIPAKTAGNRSLIFGRRGNSWHGVRALTCPEGAYRQVFIVVFEDFDPRRIFIKRAKRLLKGKPMVTEKERAMY
jgi:hypothetical protein